MGRQSTASRRRWVTYFLALLLPFAVSTGASACALCFEALRQLMTEGVRLDSADRAVLAVRENAGDLFRIVAVVKGSDALGGVIAEPVAEAGEGTSADGAPLLLIHDREASEWTSLGTIPLVDAEWLRQIAATGQIGGERPKRTWPLTVITANALSYSGWRERIALVTPYLENANPLAARLAWGELARAPYAAIEAARSRVGATAVETWIDDPKLKLRRASYLTLLGFVGEPEDAVRLDQRIVAASASHDATDLAAMIAADLELSGPARVEWIETHYFADRSRTMPEIEAALLALNVMGDADGAVPRERVVEAYRAFIRERPAMAGFVAPRLADWNCWDAAPDYSALVKSNASMDPASEFAIVNYLQRAAKAGVAMQ
jgi:hypothetical protein